MEPLSFVWLEITGKCQLACTHCYASSGPTGTHGVMSVDDWLRVIAEAADVGVGMVQFIGGEPTLHPGLPELLDAALDAGLEVEVFSNLVHITPDVWSRLERPGVRLATSYYSDSAVEHAAITKRPTYGRTKANVAEALRRSIPLRVGVIELDDAQRTGQAVEELTSMGVGDVCVDRLRQVGRGVRDVRPSAEQLCGNCANGVLAISASGEVWPCVFARWLPVGNVLTSSLGAILESPALAGTRAHLDGHFSAASCKPRCDPSCHPSCKPACQPTCAPRCSPSCAPTNCNPRRCWPRYR